MKGVQVAAEAEAVKLSLEENNSPNGFIELIEIIII